MSIVPSCHWRIHNAIFFLYQKIDVSTKIDVLTKEIKADNATFRSEMRSEMSTFRSKITKLHSDMPNVLMKHNGEIATLNERSNRFDGKAENNCDGPLNSWR